jgi:hypothetical protein
MVHTQHPELQLIKTRGGRVQHIADSKIGTIRSKPNVKYPMVRLPRERSEIIGLKAHIYETDYEGRPAFLVVPYAKDTEQVIAKPESKVSKLSLETDVEARLSALELKINTLASLLLLNEGHSLHQKPKSNGPGRIRTGDLRHVKTEGSRLSEAFFRGEITTRKANAPS